MTAHNPSDTRLDKTWRCRMCGYSHFGSAAPASCPSCGAAQKEFEPSGNTASPQQRNSLRAVIIGAGAAGVAAAKAVRQSSPDAAVTLISNESHLPYYRLNLTRYLAGEIAETDLPMCPATWYADNRIQVLTACEAARLRLDTHHVELHDGQAVPFDKLILTAGAHPFVPPIPGSRLEGVWTLRTMDDARAILSMMHDGIRCVCIGGGLQGLETAAALSRRGAQVTLIEEHAWLMPRQLTKLAADRLQRHVEGLGIRLRIGSRTREIVGNGKVAAVSLDGGERLEAELVVFATGVRPNSDLALRAGLAVGSGVIVDNHLVSSHPDVLAAGDLAEHHGVLYGTWGQAQYQGSIAGMNALGLNVEFPGPPRSHMIKVLGLGMLSIGRVFDEDGGVNVIQGDQDGRTMRFVFQEGHLVGAILLGDPALSNAARKAVEGSLDCSGLLGRRPTAKDIADYLANTAGQASTKRNPSQS